LYIHNPGAGETIPFRWAVVTLGGSNPLLVDFTSSIAELFGVLPSLFMPT
jgi:hypothetical protein